MNSPHHEIDQLPRHNHHLANRLALQQGRDPLVAAGDGFDLGTVGARRNDNLAAQLAVDLNGDLDFFILQERGIV